jgi:hypothetical protein
MEDFSSAVSEGIREVATNVDFVATSLCAQSLQAQSCNQKRKLCRKILNEKGG